MRVNERMKKVFSILLCLCMVLQYVPTTAFAATTAESGLCEHHAEHTAECGYVEAVAGSDCTHSHDDTCGYAEAVAEVLCACEATDENGALVHTEGCGYVAPVEGSNCTHVHDEACGYVAAVEAHECHYECAECAAAGASEEAPEESSEPALVCDCGTDDPAIHAVSCAVYVAPENPQCFCVEKCTEANVWCDICGFDYTQCTGTDTAAAYADGDDLAISGAWMSSSTPYLASGSKEATETKPETGYAYWDAASNTLTLNSFTSATDAATGIFYQGAADLCIKLVGNNSVTGGTGASTATHSGVGLFNTNTNILFSGGGILTATGIASGYGVYATGGNITVDSGTTLIATGVWTGHGVYADSITVNAGGSLTGNGGERGGYGVYAGTGGITVNGGSCTGNGGESGGHGVYAYSSSITVNGGSLTGNGGNSSNCCGVYAESGSITVNGGSITGNGGNSDNSSNNFGVEADSISVSGNSHILATGGSSGNIIPVGNLPEDYYYYASGDGTDKTFTHSADASLTGTVYQKYFELVTAQHLSDTYTSNGDATHSRYCSCALHTKVTAPEACSGGTATCTTPANCANCGASYGERGDHSTTAANDKAATCTALAYCSVCESEYGELDSNNHASTEFTYAANEDGTTHKKMHKCCNAVAAEAENHTPAENVTYTDNGDGTHSYICTLCGISIVEEHSFENDAHQCVCGVIETFNVYWTMAGSLMQSTSTCGQDFTQTFTVPENTHLEIYGVHLEDDSTVQVNYTYENGVLTIAAADLPAADVYIDCYHYIEVKFHANGGVIKPYDGYPLPGDTGFAEDGSYWIQKFAVGQEIDSFFVNAEVSRTGYNFVEWRDASGKVYPMAIAGNVEPYVLATEDVTLYARWQCLHTTGGVVFRDNGNGTHNGYCGECDAALGNYVERTHAYDETTHQCVCGVFKPFNLYADGQTLAVAYGSDLADAVADITPEKTGYTHTGEWTYYSLDEDDVKQSYTGTTMPAVELYAEPVYEAIQYNITWDMAGCSYYVSNYDGLPTKLAYNVDGNAHNVNFTDITAPEGYEFVRFEDGDGNALSYVITDKYRLNLTVSGDMTVKAVIEPKTYKATWVSFDGSSRSVNVKYGETITECDHEPIPGYTFLRWEGYTEDMTMPAKDVTFTAIYQVNQYTITFNTDGGSEVAPITQDYGTAVTAPAAPSRDGYHFVEWLNLPATMPAENVTIKAVWEAHKDHTYSASGNTITAKCGVCGEVVGTVSITAESKTYDGTPAAVDYHCSGSVDRNEVNLSFTKDGRYVNGEDLAEEGAYTASITLGMGEDAATASVDFTIAKKELTATVSGSMSKSYDGTNAVPERHSLNIVLNGVISGDTVTASADFAFAGVNAGTTTINATNIALSGKDAANYELKATTASADVGEIVVLDLQYLEPHDYDIVFGTEPVYNGKEQTMTVESFVMCGLDVTYELTGNTGTDAGFYTMVVTANGNFAGTITQDWQISRKAVTVTAEDQKITYGETISGTEITADGLVDGHSVTMTLTPSTANVTANGTITASAAAITADGTDVTDNYEITYTGGKLVIEPDTSRIDTLSTENVTSANEEDIKAVQEMMEDADSTKEEWETIPEKCEALLDRIAEVEAEQKEATNEAATFDEDTVNSADKENLEQLAKDIENLLDTDNLTEDEREALETVLEQVEGMIDTIEDTAEDSKAATEKIDALDPATVTSDDKDELEQAIETIDKLLTADHLTEEERSALEDAKADAEALIERIETAQDATDTENTEKVEDVTADNVKPEDKEALEDAKADLEKALEDNADNYTEEEKQAIQDEIQRIEDAMVALENVEDVTDSITQLPETVEPDDEETAKKILDAKEAYDELTDHEKSLVDETTKKKLDDLVAALTAYDIIKGDGGKWTKGGSTGLTFTANGPFSKFVGIEVDGKEVDEKYYDAKAGSTIITLKQSYLKRLSTGEHTITVLYTDGETSGTFKILAASSTPATGDNSNIMLYSSVFTVSLAGLVALLLAAKKRKQETA